MKKLNFLTIFLLLFSYLNAKDLNPSSSLVSSGAVTNLVVKDNFLYAATAASSVDIFDLNEKEKIHSIKVEQIKDFAGDIIDSKIYSTDIIDEKVLILSQGKGGGRDIYIYENEKLENIVSAKDRLFIAYAKFLDNKHIVYALLSNQIYLYDIEKKEIINEIQISQSSFSHFSFDEAKKNLFIADESGIITQIDPRTFKKIKTFKGQNVDRVFQIDIKKNTLLAGGQDRRVSLYSLGFASASYIANNFLVYSVALSPSSKLGAYALNEENDVAVFDTSSKQTKFILRNNKSLLTNILFLNEDEILVASDDNNINYYNLKD